MRTQSPCAASRVVIDAGRVLSAPLYARRRLVRWRQAWKARRLMSLVSKAATPGLMRVLRNSKRRLSAVEQEKLPANDLPGCEEGRFPESAPEMPLCRAPLDSLSPRLALAAMADALINGEEELLASVRDLRCPILTTEIFLGTPAP